MRRGHRSCSSSDERPLVRGNLPAELNRFVGRAEELAELRRLLDCSRLVTVTGTGGVGKSRLATRAAAALQNRYGDGAWLAELSALRDPSLVPHALVEALGITDQTSRPPRDVLVEHLRGRRLLIVLDGLEQPRCRRRPWKARSPPLPHRQGRGSGGLKREALHRDRDQRA